jgi:hypothetical protein
MRAKEKYRPEDNLLSIVKPSEPAAAAEDDSPTHAESAANPRHGRCFVDCLSSSQPYFKLNL